MHWEKPFWTLLRKNKIKLFLFFVYTGDKTNNHEKYHILKLLFVLISRKGQTSNVCFLNKNFQIRGNKNLIFLESVKIARMNCS